MAPQAAESIMAQNAAAQREPSMEEILASIRRIIEDSDGGKPGEADIPPAANAQAPHDMESYREALRDDEDGQAVSEAAFEPAPSAAASEPRAATITNFPAADFTASEAQAAPEEAAIESPIAAHEPEEPDALDGEGLLTSDDLTASVDPVPAPRNSIISESAGRQVAAAFDELSEALMTSRRRSFDEIAEEMIRPMLQEWLDNNLPTLVERLVREEIERVARGPAR